MYYARSDAASAGAVLAAAREELNLSVSDVARHLKLSPAQVEALEEGAYERLPGRVFVRGFLKNYAKLLGVDPQPLLRRIEHEMPKERVVEDEPPPPAPEVMPTGERSRFPVVVGVIGVIIAALAAWEFGFNAPPPGENAPAAPAASATPETPPAAPGPAGQATPVTPPAKAQGAPTPPPAAAKSAPAPVAMNEAAPPAAPQRAGERELHFRFDMESWVEIRDRNDKVIFSKLNKPGTEERVTGAPPFKLVVGNARGVRLDYDAKPVDLTPHIGVTVARLTLQ